MAKRQEHEPLQLERTRTNSTWVAVAVAIVFLVLLIIFIAQNDRKVPIHFLGANGTVSEALALIAAAVAGAILVLAITGFVSQSSPVVSLLPLALAHAQQQDAGLAFRRNRQLVAGDQRDAAPGDEG